MPRLASAAAELIVLVSVGVASSAGADQSINGAYSFRTGVLPAVVNDPDLADQVRQALAANDIERLAELIDFLNIDGPGETAVLTVAEVKP